MCRARPRGTPRGVGVACDAHGRLGARVMLLIIDAGHSAMRLPARGAMLLIIDAGHSAMRLPARGVMLLIIDAGHSAMRLPARGRPGA